VAVFISLGIPVLAQTYPAATTKLDQIFIEAKGAFYSSINRILQDHPLKSELSAAELGRLMNGAKDIPYLFERLMIFAYQKDEPRYTQWAKRGDGESLRKFHEAFLRLAEEYAARFVGSLFRKARQFEFEASLPHNIGKSRLDLVLQSLGYKARNDLPDWPKERWFTNMIEPE